MLSRLSRSAPPRVSVEFGTSALKLVVLPAGPPRDPREHSPTVHAVHMPYGALVDGALGLKLEAREALQQALSELVQSLGLQGERAALVLHEQVAPVRFFGLPKMEARELQGALNNEAFSHLPFSQADQVKLAYQIQEVSAQQELLVSASRLDTMRDFSKFFESCGLILDRAEPRLTALMRQAEFEGLIKADGELRLLIEIGASGTMLALLQGQRARVQLPLTDGGDSFTILVQNLYNLSFDDAEALKLKAALYVAAEASGAELPEWDFAPASAATVLRSLQVNAEELSLQIGAAVRYYLEEAGLKDAVSSVLLSGGASALPGLAEQFAQDFGAPAHRLGLAFASLTDFSAPAGALLPAPDSLNLILDADRGLREVSLWRPMALAALPAFALLILAPEVATQLQLSRVNAHVQKLEARSAELAPDEVRSREIRAEIARMEASLAVGRAMQADKRYWANDLALFTRLFPSKGVALESLQLNEVGEAEARDLAGKGQYDGRLLRRVFVFKAQSAAPDLGLTLVSSFENHDEWGVNLESMEYNRDLGSYNFAGSVGLLRSQQEQDAQTADQAASGQVAVAQGSQAVSETPPAPAKPIPPTSGGEP